MEAGRELDTLIAEKVMGLVLDYEFADMLGAPTVPALRDRYDEWGMLPEYSTNIEAAWAVVERMTAQGALFRLQYGRTKPVLRIGHGGQNVEYEAEWGVIFQNMPSYFESDAVAATAPLAICLAALKAVGHEVTP